MNTSTAYGWDTLASIAGATAATQIIVQFISGMLVQPTRTWTRIVSLVVAFLLLFIANSVMGTLVIWTDVFLIVVNAAFVSLAATGAMHGTAKGNGLIS